MSLGGPFILRERECLFREMILPRTALHVDAGDVEELGHAPHADAIVENEQLELAAAEVHEVAQVDGEVVPLLSVQAGDLQNPLGAVVPAR